MRILTRLALPGLPFLLFGNLAGAHELDVGFNDGAVRAMYATNLSNGVRLDAGWLSDSDGQEGDVVHASLLVTGNAAPAGQQLVAGVGARLAYLDAEGSQRTGYALGVGGSVRWPIPRYNRFSVYGEYFWAPDILSGGDAEKYVDGTIRLAYGINPQADIYVGARYTGADYDDRPSVRFDTGMHVGFAIRF